MFIVLSNDFAMQISKTQIILVGTEVLSQLWALEPFDKGNLVKSDRICLLDKQNLIKSHTFPRSELLTLSPMPFDKLKLVKSAGAKTSSEELRMALTSFDLVKYQVLSSFDKEKLVKCQVLSSFDKEKLVKWRVQSSELSSFDKEKLVKCRVLSSEL